MNLLYQFTFVILQINSNIWCISIFWDGLPENRTVEFSITYMVEYQLNTLQIEENRNCSILKFASKCGKWRFPTFLHIPEVNVPVFLDGPYNNQMFNFLGNFGKILEDVFDKLLQK